DAAEILSDLEHAIGEKCNESLGSHKNVVSAEEISTILAELGPIEGAAQATQDRDTTDSQEADAAGSAPEGGTPQRKLYRLKDGGSKLGGVCNGLAAYLDIDVVLLRVAFIALAVLSGGLFLLVWFAMLFLVPIANTDAEQAAARAAIKPPVHRIYRLPTEGMFGGVCAGLATYFDVEPVLVRIAFVGLSVFTGSIWILVWLALLLLTPAARTEEELAAVRRGNGA
ncbi:MAG: Phage shock protein, partial [Pseudomonadota bacterium]